MPLGLDGRPSFGPVIQGSLAQWRAANPGALVANVAHRVDLTDADFVHFRGIRALSMWGCTQEGITDAAFEHLKGIHTLHMGGCSQAGITSAAFAHLRGIHTLDMSGCTQRTITDAAFAHLGGINTLTMNGCIQDTITDAAFAKLAGIHSLRMDGRSLGSSSIAAAQPIQAAGPGGEGGFTTFASWRG